ncbi:TIGR04282 family arsenosugar biosynthesis glycosyltransferase [Pacificimonas sp. WHA3]|uniref:TIGR04282 family arsenosugar biosynthesis glycosyltransferase n=1 Tax=Pacificimonas pallii TaxID=2827236 RepID=A0ABS6SH47_9SPHN|nr:TIGR04282 family arsenosugar biosynthesis glycosyltransferase [Pacificimonas pallii]MBV7257725.1 TIGR04282 family arsenosugar biosynthesis glycosyltransferase [Pacificimonas pallii]
MIRPIIFARYPEPGRCKTRMIPMLGADGAAMLQARLVTRALDRLAPLLPILSVTGGDDRAWRTRFGAGISLRKDAGDDLGARMLAALIPGPAIVVGSDVPGMSAELVSAAAMQLDAHDAVFGPAEDGGFWLVGMTRPDPRLFEGVRWGTDDVLAAVMANAARCDISVARAATLADCDCPEDLRHWPELAAGLVPGA